MPASSRSGAQFHSMSSSETDAVAPPPQTSGGPDSRKRTGDTSTPEPNGANSLCPGERAVVDAERGELERPVRRELGGVDAELGARLVREARPERDVGHVAGDVRGARDGDHLDAAAQRREQRVEVVDIGRAVLEQAHVAVVHPAPRQQVRVVLRRGRQHDRALAVLVQQQARDLVQPVGRVAREDDGLVGARADEAVHGRARSLVRVGGDASAHAGAAVDRSVPRQQLEHARDDAGERRGGRRVVEVRLLLGGARRTQDIEQGATGEHPVTPVAPATMIR